MIDKIRIWENDSYNLSFHFREYSAKITNSGVERDYFFRFPW